MPKNKKGKSEGKKKGGGMFMCCAAAPRNRAPAQRPAAAAPGLPEPTAESAPGLPEPAAESALASVEALHQPVSASLQVELDGCARSAHPAPARCLDDVPGLTQRLSPTGAGRLPPSGAARRRCCSSDLSREPDPSRNLCRGTR